MSIHRRFGSAATWARCSAAVAACAFAMAASSVFAANGWDGGGNSNWWFDPVNWGDPSGYLPPYQSADGTNNPYPVANDVQINNGWNAAGEGVVYDPVNDPFKTAANAATYFSAPFDADKGGILNRIYIGRNVNTPQITNLLTIKSGTLAFAARPADPLAPTTPTDFTGTQSTTIIIGRSGSSPDNLGRVNQVGGTVTITTTALDLAARETSGWGNGTYDYRGGILSQTNVNGIRLSTGGTVSGANAAGGVGRFIMHNPATGGYVRTASMAIVTGTGPGGLANVLNPDGLITGVGVVEFHYENGGVRPIQITGNLNINNGVISATNDGKRSSRLELKLDAAPTVTAGVPQNLGLFDIGGGIGGGGDLDNDLNYSNDRVFSNSAGTTHYREGDTVSAILGSTKYNWTISYTGAIAFSDADNSVVSSILGPMNGADVVLMGLSTETVAVDNANFDGSAKVDGHDFLIWQRGLGVGTNLATGDANNSNSVTSADLGVWKTQFGTPTVAVAGSVPEPSSAMLLAAACAALAARRRRG